MSLAKLCPHPASRAVTAADCPLCRSAARERSEAWANIRGFVSDLARRVLWLMVAGWILAAAWDRSIAVLVPGAPAMPWEAAIAIIGFAVSARIAWGGLR